MVKALCGESLSIREISTIIEKMRVIVNNIYDDHLIIQRLISSQVVECRQEGGRRHIAIDKDIAGPLSARNPQASALLLYLSISMGENNIAQFTMSEVMRAMGLNRTAIRGALGFLTDLDYVLPLRENPASIMML